MIAIGQTTGTKAIADTEIESQGVPPANGARRACFPNAGCYQPARSVAASAADLPSLPVCHWVATKRRPVIPSASGDTSQSNGGTMIEGSSSADFAGRARGLRLSQWQRGLGFDSSGEYFLQGIPYSHL
jgi:hypothetical protein